MGKTVVGLLLALLAAGPLLAREPGFAEFRAVQESLSGVHPRFREWWLKSHGYDVVDFMPSYSPNFDSLGLRLVGKYGRGPSVEVTGRDTLVALTLGSEVALLNFANPDQPQVISEIQLDFMPAQSVLADSLLITGGRGMDIWNVADPAHPTRISRFPIGAGDFCVQDSLVCFIQTDTFRVYSIRDPATPRLLGCYPDSGYVLTISGNTVVAGHPSVGLFFVDVSDPAQPHRVGTYPSDYPLSAQARGNLCCASFESNAEPYPIRFVTLDISNPASVQQLARIDSAGGYDIYLWDTLAFASGRDRAYAEESQVINIADSVHPRILGRGTTPYDNWGVWACPPRHLAYVADRGKGLSVFDITDLADPVRDTGIMVADLAYDVAIDGNRAYVANYVGGLRILDVSDPARPRELGGIDSTEISVRTVTAKDSFAYVGWAQPPFLRTIDVTDPSTPRTAGGCSVTGWPEDVVLKDSLLYVAQAYRFQIVNVARPRQPVLVGSCVTADVTHAGLCLRDTVAYIAYWPTEVINVADPTHPVKIGEFQRGADNIDVAGTLAFLAGGGLYVYNVANPANPVIVDSLVGWPYAFAVAVVETLAYVGCRDAVRLVNVADPHNMRVIASSPVPDLVWKMTFAAPYLYASCFGAGVSIFDSVTTALHEPGPSESRRRSIRLLPSPAHDRLTVEIPNTLREEVMCDAYTVAGARVLVPVLVSVGSGWTSLNIDLRSVSAGVYLLRVCVGKTVYPLRIAKL